MSTRLEQQLDRLELRLDALRREWKSPEPRPEALEGLAECGFRIAVHPDTPFPRAVELLQESIRCDGANPKYAYHLSRLCFLHGLLPEAQHWMATACRLCPTSHRIWSHIFLLNAEIHGRHYRDIHRDRYDLDAVSRRRDAIAAAVKGAVNQFEQELLDFTVPASQAVQESQERVGSAGPRRSRNGNADQNGEDGQNDADENGNPSLRTPSLRKVRRLRDADRCRWSGIHDLVLEDALKGVARQNSVPRLAESLEAVAQLARHRHGGLAGFAILSVQWIVVGYPTATVRRLMAGFSPDETAASAGLQLLDLVCTLYELPESDLPARLTQALHEGRLPPVLAAIIHRRRSLWRPVEFRTHRQYRQARRFLAEVRGKLAAGGDPASFRNELNEWARKIEQALARLDPAPPRVLVDVPPQPAATIEPAADKLSQTAWLEQLSTAAAALLTIRDETFAFVRDDLGGRADASPAGDALGAACADREAAAAIGEGVKTSANEGAARLQALRDELSAHPSSEAPESFGAKLEECANRFRDALNVSNLRRKLDRISKLLVVEGAAQPGAVHPTLNELRSRLAGIFAPPPAAPPSQPDATNDAGDLDVLKAQVASILSQLDEEYARLTELVKKHESEELSADDLQTIGEVKRTFEAAMKSREEMLQAVTKLHEAGRIPRDQLESLDKVQQDVQGLAQRRRPFLRSFGKLPEPCPTPAAPFPPSPLPVPERAEVVSPSASNAVPAVAPPRPRKPSPLDPLQSALNRLDDRLQQSFNVARATFQNYPDWVMQLPPMQSVHTSLLARQSEVLFRLGRRAEARRACAAILRADPLNRAVRKNVAICDATGADEARAMQSWRAYADLLYFHAVVSGDPMREGEARADFHRAFAGAFGTRFLVDKYDPALLEEEETIAFFNDSSRVREFIDHKLLEFLNRMLVACSPLVALGVTRDDPPDERAAALESVVPLVDEACRRLHGGIAKAVRSLFVSRLEEAAAQSKDRNRLLAKNDVTYADDRARHLDLLNEFTLLKHKLYEMVGGAKKLWTRVRSTDFLEELLRLDALPVAHSTAFALPLAQMLRIDRETLAHYVRERVAPHAASGLLNFLNGSADENETQSAVRLDQLQRFVESWARRPAFAPIVPVVDNSRDFFPKSLQEQIDRVAEEGLSPTFVDAMKEFYDRFGDVSSVTQDYAQILIQLDRTDEAIAVLRRGAERGLSEPGRRHCRWSAANQQRNRAINDEDAVAAVPLILELLSLDDRTAALIDHVISDHVNAAGATGVDPGIEAMIHAIDAWETRARAALDGDHPTPNLNADDLAELERKKSEGLVRIRRALMIFCNNRGMNHGKAGQKAASRFDFDAAIEHAKYVIQHGDDQQRAEANELVSRVAEPIG